MFRNSLCVLALCLLLSPLVRGGDTPNPGIEPDPSPTPTPEMSQQQAAPSTGDTLLNDIVVTFAPFIPALF